MSWRVLGTGEPGEWHAVLRRFARADVYFLPEYHRAYELNGDGTAHAFVAEEGEQVLFYPFLVRPIWAGGAGPARAVGYDLETVYGYSGPLCTTADPAFLAGAWAAFADWCRQRGVVAEFIRFNPTLDNHAFAGGGCRVALDRETVVLRLDCSEQELWDGYPAVQRNMVRKTVKHGLVCEEVPPDAGAAAFRRLYRANMEGAGAARYYSFSEPYFTHLFGALGPHLKLFVVRDGDRAVAAALFLVYGEQVHYHLAGSDPARRGAAPNNLLLHTAALWARERGFRRLHLGGGRTASPDDSLYRFKAGLSRQRLPFHVGMRVHDADAYERLCADWMRRHGVADRPPYFLLYRLEGRP